MKRRVRYIRRDVPLECYRCGYMWFPQVRHPKQCPLCHSPYWDRPRRWFTRK